MQRVPHEGAWFAPTHLSAELVALAALPARYSARAGGDGARDASPGEARAVGRPLSGAILALVTRRDFSALHRLRTDELWHFHEGDVAELLILHPDGRDELVNFGPDTLAGQRAQVVVPAGAWMGARPARAAADAYSFFGCTLAPAFAYDDYEPGAREALCAAYPARAALIVELTRG